MTLQRSIPPLLALLAMGAAVAVGAGQVNPATEGACNAATVTRLYLGQNTPDGAVTEAQWRAFVAEDVTPRFPAGLVQQCFEAAGG